MTDRGKRVGSYLLLDELGKGGMGNVYLAEHIQTGKVVALKTVRLAKRKLLSQLRREIDALSQIQHPGIVGIVEQGVHGGRPWYAMELVTGTTLRDYLRETFPAHLTDMTVEEAPQTQRSHQQDSHPSLDYIIDWIDDGESLPDPTMEEDPSHSTQTTTQSPGETVKEGTLFRWNILEEEETTKPSASQNLQNSLKAAYGLSITLAYLHGEGIVHCDLKPENIILQEDGWPVLIDFGLLVQFAGGVNREVLELTQEGAGTLPYMSPEQINGDLLDARSDIYAMGCILYEMLVGEPPFVGHHYDVVAQHLFETPIPPSERVRGIPPALNQLVMRMLAKERQDRIGYADVVGGFLQEIDPALRTQTPFGEYQLQVQPPEGEPVLTPRLRLTEENQPPSSPDDTYPEVPTIPKKRKEAVTHTLLPELGEETIPLSGDEKDRSSIVAHKGQRSTTLLQLPLPRVYLYRPSLTGRHESWDKLKAKIDALRKKKTSGLVLLGGESGLGKTRLILELAQYARVKQLQIIVSRCQEHFAPAMSMFHPFLEAMGDKVRERQGFELPFFETDTELVAPIQTFVHSEPEQLFVTGTQAPSHAHLRVYRTLQQQLEKFSAEQPLLFLIDDLHLADELSLGALAYLSRPNTLPNVLFVGAYRSEECPIALKMLSNQKSVSQVSLGRLKDEDITATVGDMLAMSEVPERLANTLIRYAQGNPYFVAEYLHVAVAEGLLQRDMGGQWHFDSLLIPEPNQKHQDLSLNVPSALRALVLRRVAKLPAESRMLLAVTAVLGREAPISLLHLVTGMPSKKWWKVVEQLQRLLILETTGNDTLRFAHEQFRDAIYAEMSEAARAMYHCKIAEVMEQHWTKEIELHYATLAHHWRHANELEKAANYYKLAAELARSKYATEEAIRSYQSFLQIQTSSAKEYLTVKLALAELLTLQGHIEPAHETLRQALDLVRQQHKPFTEAQVHLRMGKLLWHQGHREESRLSTEEALGLYRQLGDRRGIGSTLAHLGHCSYYQSKWKEAQKYYQEAMYLYRQADDQLDQGQMILNLARLSSRQGKLPEARELCQNALACFHELAASRPEALALEQMAYIELYQENLEQAQRLATRALQTFREEGDPFHEGMALGTLARISQNAGQVDNALQMFRDAIALHQKIQHPLFAAVHQLQRISLERLMGYNLRDLELEIAEVEKFLKKTQDPFYLSILQCERGHIELAKRRSANRQVREARRTLTSAHIDPYAPTEAGIRLQRLSNAQHRFSKNIRLFKGEDLQSLPAKLRESLQKKSQS